MIKKEDIKVGLEFILPYSEEKYNEEVEQFRRRIIMGEDRAVLPRYYKTELKTFEGIKTIETHARPVFKVIGAPMKQFGYDFGSFSVVTCSEFKGSVFTLTTEDIVERAEVSDSKKFAKMKEALMGSKHSPDILDIFANTHAGDADRFKEITDKMCDIYKRKNHDYGNAFSEMYDELGINYGYGKIREKVNRIKTLKDNEAQVANEPLEDALLDCANYCILTLMEYQKRKEHGTD